MGVSILRSRRLGVERLEGRALMTASPTDGHLAATLDGQSIENASLGPAATLVRASAATSSVLPSLASRPGARATLYLDFDGNFESQWGGHTNIVTPPYDADGNPARFSAAEIADIREIWSRVAEDYAPFNINVTTIAPPVIADRVAVRIAIGGSYSDWYGSSAGGVSYVGGFANSSPNIGFVFSDALSAGDARYTAEAASHEAGHLFGLEHQADWNGGQLASQYNSGNADWAPIMGVGYYADRTTWTLGPTSAGPSSRQDDLAILSGPANGFGYAADDYGDTLTTAATLPISGTSVHVAGLIGRNGDRDLFRFTTAGGMLNLSLQTAAVGADLDAVLEIENAAGQTIALASPAGSLDASLTTRLAAGTYYVVVRSSGGYGNLGRYTLSGAIPGSTSQPNTPPPNQQPQPPPPPTNPATDQGEGESGSAATSAPRIVDDGGAGYMATGLWQSSAAAGYASDTRFAAAGSAAASTWTFTGLSPGQYRLAATWTGSRLNASAAPFSAYSGNQLLGTVHVNQQRSSSTFTADGAAWQSLGTFTVTGSALTVRLNSATSGRVVADAVRLERVYATTGGSALAHNALTPSNVDAALLSWLLNDPAANGGDIHAGSSGSADRRALDRVAGLCEG